MNITNCSQIECKSHLESVLWKEGLLSNTSNVWSVFTEYVYIYVSRKIQYLSKIYFHADFW